MKSITRHFTVAVLLCALVVLVTTETSYAAVVVQGTVADSSTQAGIVGGTVRMRLCFSADDFAFDCGIAQTTTGADGQYAFDTSQLDEAFANGFHIDVVAASVTSM
jgi:hypothetical protein